MVGLGLATAAFAPATGASAAAPTISVSTLEHGFMVKGQGWPPGATVHIAKYMSGYGYEKIGSDVGSQAEPATRLVACPQPGQPLLRCSVANPDAGTFDFTFDHSCTTGKPETVYIEAYGWSPQDLHHLFEIKAFDSGTAGCDVPK
jgi:hypothetical protein